MTFLSRFIWKMPHFLGDARRSRGSEAQEKACDLSAHMSHADISFLPLDEAPEDRVKSLPFRFPLFMTLPQKSHGGIAEGRSWPGGILPRPGEEGSAPGLKDFTWSVPQVLKVLRLILLAPREKAWWASHGHLWGSGHP